MADAPPTQQAQKSLSCFAKGIIHSMETEGHSWKRDYWLDNTPCWTHSESRVQWRMGGSCLSIRHNPVPLSFEESFAISSAAEQYLEAAYQQRIKEWALADARKIEDDIAKAKASFEKLGCPDQS